jgi:hypothetical protein
LFKLKDHWCEQGKNRAHAMPHTLPQLGQNLD